MQVAITKNYCSKETELIKLNEILLLRIQDLIHVLLANLSTCSGQIESHACCAMENLDAFKDLAKPYVILKRSVIFEFT